MYFSNSLERMKTHYTQSYIFQAFILVNFDDYGLELLKKSKITFLKTFYYAIRQINREFLNKEMLFYVFH